MRKLKTYEHIKGRRDERTKNERMQVLVELSEQNERQKKRTMLAIL